MVEQMRDVNLTEGIYVNREDVGGRIAHISERLSTMSTIEATCSMPPA